MSTGILWNGVKVLTAMFAIAAIALDWPLGEGQVDSHPRSPLANAKLAALALAMYTTDYDDLLPPGMADSRLISKELTPYDWRDDLMEGAGSRRDHFVPNPNLACVDSSAIQWPERTVLLYDPYVDPERGRIVAYADYHTEYVQGFDPERDLQVRLVPKDVLERQRSKRR